MGKVCTSWSRMPVGYVKDYRTKYVRVPSH